MTKMMKQIVNRVLISLLAMCAICVTSCSKDNDGIEHQAEEDRYYVKYEMTISPPIKYYQLSTKISCLGDKGPVNLNTNNTSWSATYGPIKKDSKLFLDVDCNYTFSNRNDSYARIWVSKNKEPFVLKAEDIGTTSSNTLHASCGIDF